MEERSFYMRLPQLLAEALLRVTGFISKYLLLLDKAGPNGIATVAGIKGSLLPHGGITTHEYYLSDRLSAARTQSVAGRNKIESFRSIDHEHLSVGR